MIEAKNCAPTLLALMNSVDYGHAIDDPADYHCVCVKGGAGSTTIEAAMAEFIHIHSLGDTRRHDDMPTFGREKSVVVAYEHGRKTTL